MSREPMVEERHCDRHGPWMAVILPNPFVPGKMLTPICPECEKNDARNREEEARQSGLQSRQAWFEKAIGRAGIEARFQGKGFADFQAGTKDQAKALAVARRYLETLADRLAGGDSLVFCGGPGTGKSHLTAAIIVGAIRAGRTAAYLSVYDLILAARATYANSGVTLQKVLDALIEVDLLAIDEVGAKVGNEDIWLLSALIDGRYRRQRPTIIVTNLTPEQLEGYLGVRIMDRLREGKGVVLAFTWESHRRKTTITKDEAA